MSQDSECDIAPLQVETHIELPGSSRKNGTGAAARSLASGQEQGYTMADHHTAILPAQFAFDVEPSGRAKCMESPGKQISGQVVDPGAMGRIFANQDIDTVVFMPPPGRQNYEKLKRVPLVDFNIGVNEQGGIYSEPVNTKSAQQLKNGFAIRIHRPSGTP